MQTWMSSMRSGVLSRRQWCPWEVQLARRKGTAGYEPRCSPVCSSISDSTCTYILLPPSAADIITVPNVASCCCKLVQAECYKAVTCICIWGQLSMQ